MNVIFIDLGKADALVKRRADQKRRRIMMLVLVVAVFATCWMPINLYHLSADLHLIEHNYKIFLACHWFAMSSVCYNPFIYCWLNTTFRNEAKQFFWCITHCRLRSPHRNGSNGDHRNGNASSRIHLNINDDTFELASNVSTQRRRSFGETSCYEFGNNRNVTLITSSNNQNESNNSSSTDQINNNSDNNLNIDGNPTYGNQLNRQSVDLNQSVCGDSKSSHNDVMSRESVDTGIGSSQTSKKISLVNPASANTILIVSHESHYDNSERKLVMASLLIHQKDSSPSGDGIGKVVCDNQDNDIYLEDRVVKEQQHMGSKCLIQPNENCMFRDEDRR